MVHYTFEEYRDIIMCYGEATSNSYEAQRIYRERYPLRQVPNVRTFIDVHRRLREDGCFRKPKLNSGVSRTRRTVRNEETVLRMVENNPRTSTRKTSSVVRNVNRMSSGEKWKFKKALTVQELEAILEEDSDLEEINEIDAVYVPPDVDSLTDEENLDEDLLAGENLSMDIVGTIEIHTQALENDNFVEPPPGPSSSKKKKISSKSKSKQYVPSWKKLEPSYSSVPTKNEFQKMQEIKQQVGGKSPLEVLLLFFDDTVLNAIVNYSLKYAQDNNRHDFKFSVSLLKQFLGILILTGYHTLPACDMYLSKNADKGVDLVRGCMSRNTFRSIKRNLHLADNSSLDNADKFSKLRPVFSLLNEKYLQFGIFTHNLSIDEQMIPYFGRHSAKMFIKGKPVRFGFKIWCLCSSGGYLYQFIPYGGAASKDSQQEQEHSLGTRVVLDLLSVVPDASLYKVFFDNFFSSYSLFNILNEKGFFFTGTVRENRLPNCPMQSSKILRKQKRGEFDFTFDESAQIPYTTMPRNYKKKLGVTAKFRYNKVYMENALKAVVRGQMSLRAASTNYGVPYTTLHRKYQAHLKGDNQRTIGGQPVLSDVEENILVECLLLCANWGPPLQRYDVRCIVQQYLNKAGAHTEKNWKTKEKPEENPKPGVVKEARERIKGIKQDDKKEAKQKEAITSKTDDSILMSV
ncbi:transposase is4 [Holotrichia oblita]|uniref:Transposase is4 n=1 Tax=Holotrichia oblita TaxID=644536 RepID=A0ACB9TS67_HOLOL|nr:transposase is4 [Holotrichia oblita]